MNKTPETDAAWKEGNAIREWTCRKLERERDEAREAIRALAEHGESEIQRITNERDEALEKLSDWENTAAHVEADHPDEKHCGCVHVLRKLLTDAREQIKELIYIAGRAIELAEINFENDKFGVVSELRNDLDKIKESK